MKKSYRIQIETIYTAALQSVRVKAKKVTAHRDASATVRGDEKVVSAVKRLPDVEVISEGKGEITFRIPAAQEYHNAHPPLFTDAEKAQQEADKEARRRERKQREDEAFMAEGDDDQEVGE